MDRFIIDNWTQEDYNSLILYLKSQADLKYRDFHSKLIPNCDKEYFIGIRVPVMRKLGKAICKGNPRSFLKVCGNKYYEESMLYTALSGCGCVRLFYTYRFFCVKRRTWRSKKSAGN